MSPEEQRKAAYSGSTNVNQGLEQRRRIPCLKENVPYVVTKVAPLAAHAEYGQGYKVHLRDSDKKLFFVILPSRIVTKIGLANFDQYNIDVQAKRPPFLSFMGMDGNAFKIAIEPFSLELVKFAVKGEIYSAPKPSEPETDDFDWLDNLAAGCSSEHSESVAQVKEDGEVREDGEVKIVADVKEDGEVKIVADGKEAADTEVVVPPIKKIKTER